MERRNAMISENTYTLLTQININDCEGLALEWVRRNRTQFVDAIDVSLILQMVEDAIVYMSKDELTQLDNAVRAESHDRAAKEYEEISSRLKADIELSAKNRAENPLLKTWEAAEMCRLSASTLAKLRMKGEGPKHVKLGRRVFYRVNDVKAWINSNTNTEE